MFALTTMAPSLALSVLVCALGLVSGAYPDQYPALHSYLNGRHPKYYGHQEYISPRLKMQQNSDDDFEEGTSSAPVMNGVLVSQNRKYLAKSPEHDAHFRNILRQQEAATIKDPGQAAMVASDQMELRSRLRHSLQTSDDDVYEVESAPVMKSTPYRSTGGRYRKNRDHERGRTEGREQSDAREQPEDMEFPVSVNFESNIDHGHSYEPKQSHQPAKQRHREVSYANQMPMKFIDEGEPTEPDYEGPDKYARPYPVAENPNFSLGLADDENTISHNSVRPSTASHYKSPKSSHRGQGRAKVSTYHQQPQYHHEVQYSQIPTDSYQPGTTHQIIKQPRYFAQTESEYRGPGSYSAAPTTSQYMHDPRDHREVTYASQPVVPKYPKTHHAPMESSWLDMGAYSSGKGAFGWYSDVPVGGQTLAEKKKK